MKKIQVDSGTPLTSNLVNDISNYILSGISDFIGKSFSGGVVSQSSGIPFEITPTIVGQNVNIEIGPGVVIFPDGTVVNCTSPDFPKSITVSPTGTYFYIGLQYSYVNGNPTYRKEITVNVFTSNTSIALFGNQIQLGAIDLSSGSANVDYSVRHIFTFSNLVKLLTTIPENSNSTLIPSSYQFGQKISFEDHIHAIGTGVVSPRNPHGLSLKDIEDWTETKLVETHEKQFHRNGILFTPSSNKTIFTKQNAVIALGGTSYNYLRITFPSDSLLFLNGKTFDKNLFKPIEVFLGTFSGNSFDSLMPDGVYLIVVTNDNLSLKPYVIRLDSMIQEVPNNKFSWKYQGERNWNVVFQPWSNQSSTLLSSSLPICAVRWYQNTRTFDFINETEGAPNGAPCVNLLYSDIKDNAFPGDIKLHPIKNPQISNLPLGWALCNGGYLSVYAHPELFSIIGFTYGSLSSNIFPGSTDVYFKLPNLSVTVGSDTYRYIIKL